MNRAKDALIRVLITVMCGRKGWREWQSWPKPPEEGMNYVER